MSTKIAVNWKKDMAFDGIIGDTKIGLDTSVENGGQPGCVSPKPLLLVALGGCTGMDVASLLKKFRIDFTTLNMDVEAESREEHPVVYTSLKLSYHIETSDPATDKILKAVKMSMDRYCGVSAMLSKVAPITWFLYVNGKEIASETKLSD